MSDRPSDEELERLIGYSFLKKDLLQTALTHPSLGDGKRSKDREANGRLEFLGDAVLGLVAADILYSSSPLHDEGALTEARKAVVSNERVREIAARLQLGRWLHLGGTERADGGRGEAKRLGDALEAIAGAIYLDAGPAHAKNVLVGLLEKYPARPV